MAQTTSQPPSSRHPITAALAARPPWAPAPLTRLLSNVSGTVRSVAATIDGIERTWHELVHRSLREAGAITSEPPGSADRPPLWVVLGDSTAQGVGASSLDHSWVSRIEAALHDAGRRHAVINLSRSGAHTTHVIDEQLPLLDHLPYTPSLVTVCVGANDLMRNPYPPRLAGRLERLADAVPTGTIIASLPGPRLSPTALYVNQSIRRAAEANGHLVAELGRHWVAPHRGLSADRFHPNDTGYGSWVRAFAEPLGIDADLVPLRGTVTSREPDPARHETRASG